MQALPLLLVILFKVRICRTKRCSSKELRCLDYLISLPAVGLTELIVILDGGLFGLTTVSAISSLAIGRYK